MPLVSCIMATKNRPLFLKQAIKYFRAQTFTDSELIIVDDSLSSCEHLVSQDPRILYIRLSPGAQLGEKLNLGIHASSGSIIQKLDDDDYYHPEFLETTVSTLHCQPHRNVVIAMGTFLVHVVGQPHLYDAGTGWFAGGTLCFFRDIWERRPFRLLAFREDAGFLEDHPHIRKVAIQKPELYILIRHGDHTWNLMKSDGDNPGRAWPEGMDVPEYFSACPIYPKSITQVMSADAARFYAELGDPTLYAYPPNADPDPPVSHLRLP